MRTIKIGNASGYWGDDPEALSRQLSGGDLDYLSMDFLAEVTMSIMQKQKNRNPHLGYATDFTNMLKPLISEIIAKDVCIITNAGGVSPFACAKAIAELSNEQLRIAIVHGDDILDRLDILRQQGVSFTNMEDGGDFAKIASTIEAANVYFGASAVVRALQDKPHIIVSGRVTDTGITLAPLIHEFSWQLDDWDKLASGVIAGHLLECGAQVSGGNFTDWHLVKKFTPMGYPIVEMAEDGSFVVTKHPDSGGLVSVDTVREQLFYEMGDPRNYIAPDVVCDFTQLSLTQEGDDRVRVVGAKGRPCTPTYKVSMCYRDGYKASGTIIVSGPRAVKKAEKFAEIFWQRCQSKFAEQLTEFCGWNSCHRSLTPAIDGDEILLRLSVRGNDRKEIKKFAKLVPALILSGPPGVAIVGGAPKVRDIISYWPALVPKDLVYPRTTIWGSNDDVEVHQRPQPLADSSIPKLAVQMANSIIDLPTDGQGVEVLLEQLCLARSGDKGDAVNIGVLARNSEIYAFLDSYLTAQRLKNYFQDFCQGSVIRYPLANLQGFNFILNKALGGGGTKSLRIDAQGKTLAQALLRQKIYLPTDSPLLVDGLVTTPVNF